MPATAQPFTANVDPSTLKLLMDNFDKLEHPKAPGGELAPHPYLNDIFGPAPQERNEIKKQFCEAIILLLEKEKPQGAKEAVELLESNLSCLQHPVRWIKHPVFDDRFAANPQQVRETRRIYAEAIISLFEKHGKIKRRPGRPRKSDAEPDA